MEVPAWRTTITASRSGTASSAAARASTRIRPSSSAATSVGVPNPRYRSARSTLSCRSTPASTCTGGAPAARGLDVPPDAGQHGVPARRQADEVGHRRAGRERDGRAAGRPSRSRNQAPAVSSRATTPGVGDRIPAFWSHALTSQSAARAAGSVPPMTQPKNRPDWIAINPGSVARAICSTTAVGAVGPPAADRRPRRAPPPPTRRAGPAACPATRSSPGPARARRPAVPRMRLVRLPRRNGSGVRRPCRRPSRGRSPSSRPC